MTHLADQWGPTIHESARGFDISAFDKPGTYNPATILYVPFGSGARTTEGYVRDDEAKAGAKAFADYVKSWERQVKELSSGRGRLWDDWLSLVGSEEKLKERLEEMRQQLGVLRKAKSIEDIKGIIAPIDGPAEYQGRLILLKKNANRAIARNHVVEEAEKRGASAVVKLVNAGIVISDKPDMAAVADQTKKAIAFVKRRFKGIAQQYEQSVAEALKVVHEEANDAVGSAKAKYPMADPAQLPYVGELMATIS